MNNPNLDEVLKVLKDGGESPEDIAEVVQDITNAASAKLYLEMMAVLTEEDLKLLDNCQSEEEANPLLRSLYATRTNTSPEALVSQFMATFSESFIDKYNSDRAAAMAQPVELQPQTELQPAQNPAV